jgi:2-amino-4-hydroxy-6-hydroxymethyldihydropteridine diphosphokinase
MQIEDLMFISLGSNMGDRLGYLLKARHFLSEIYGEAKLASSIYQSDAWGGVTHEDFLNQVLAFSKAESPKDVLSMCFAIEHRLGRRRSQKNAARTIDLDILLFGNSSVQMDQLSIPHKRMHTRKFVLQPLMEVAPTLVLPKLQKSVEKLYKTLDDKIHVALWKG